MPLLNFYFFEGTLQVKVGRSFLLCCSGGAEGGTRARRGYVEKYLWENLVVWGRVCNFAVAKKLFINFVEKFGCLQPHKKMLKLRSKLLLRERAPLERRRHSSKAALAAQAWKDGVKSTFLRTVA